MRRVQAAADAFAISAAIPEDFSRFETSRDLRHPWVTTCSGGCSAFRERWNERVDDAVGFDTAEPDTLIGGTRDCRGNGSNNMQMRSRSRSRDSPPMRLHRPTKHIVLPFAEFSSTNLMFPNPTLFARQAETNEYFSDFKDFFQALDPL